MSSKVGRTERRVDDGGRSASGRREGRAKGRLEWTGVVEGRTTTIPLSKSLPVVRPAHGASRHSYNIGATSPVEPHGLSSSYHEWTASSLARNRAVPIHSLGKNTPTFTESKHHRRTHAPSSHVLTPPLYFTTPSSRPKSAKKWWYLHKLPRRGSNSRSCDCWIIGFEIA